jgi:hypothetical protein
MTEQVALDKGWAEPTETIRTFTSGVATGRSTPPSSRATTARSRAGVKTQRCRAGVLAGWSSTEYRTFAGCVPGKDDDRLGVYICRLRSPFERGDPAEVGSEYSAC